ncbi:MAG TPA: deoxyribose-phosphate aldolase [Gemmatimonadales bacterium]|nr:deoxyribose-phosphate aldolase [Gemmatimonadales bacterium]
MPDNGWRRRRRVIRHGGGQIIDEARAVVEAWRTAPHQAADGLPEWLADAADAPGIGHLIDHTLLRPETGRDAILTLCDEAVRYGLKSVCVNGGWVEDCVSRLARSEVTVVTVVGFPLGAATTKAKAAEARLAAGAGASELGMVMAIGQAKSGEWRYVEDDIGRVVDAVGDDVPVSVILETGALEPVEMAAGCLVARAAGAAFVKSSTGFHPAGGATEGAISLLRRSVGSELGVKASGGVRTAEAALRMLAAGANRIGTSSAAVMGSVLGPSAQPLRELMALGSASAREGGPSSPVSGY